MAFDKDPDKVLNKALANIGSLFADEVEGRVATEIDLRSAHDAGEQKLTMGSLSTVCLPQYLLVGLNRASPKQNNRIGEWL